MVTSSVNDAQLWQSEISDVFVEFKVDNRGTPFSASLDRHFLGNGVSITRVDADPSHVLRTPDLVRDGRDDVLFLLHIEGKGTVIRNGDRTSMPAGYGSLHTADKPYELLFETRSREIVLQMPRRIITSRGLCRSTDLQIGIGPNEPALRVLRSFSNEILAVSEGMTAQLQAEMGHTALELLLSAVLHRSRADVARSSGSEALLQSIRSYIHENAKDPGFTVSAVASHHGISMRYVELLVAQSGTSPARLIRDTRLAFASDLLINPRYQNGTVEAIAHMSGFSDVGTFIRAFKRVHGQTPGNWRANL